MEVGGFGHIWLTEWLSPQTEEEDEADRAEAREATRAEARDGSDANGNYLACWNFDRVKQGPEYSYFNTPVTFYMFNSLHVTGDRARAAIHTCAQMGWPVPDQCSPDAIATFDY